MERFVCSKCGQTYSHKSSLSRHQKSCFGGGSHSSSNKDSNNGERSNNGESSNNSRARANSERDSSTSFPSERVFSCPHCTRVFSRRDNMKQHIQRTHNDSDQAYFCGMCPQMFHSLRDLMSHRESAHKARGSFSLVATAHGGACQVHRLDFPEDIVLLGDAYRYARTKAKQLFLRLTAEKKHLKASLVFVLRFRQANQLGSPPEDVGGSGGSRERDARHGIEGTDVVTINIRSNAESITFMGDHEQAMERMMEKVNRTFDDFVRNGSGWVMVDAVACNIEVGECVPLNGGATGGESGCEVLHTTVMKRQGRQHIIVDARGQRDAELHAQVLREGNRCFLYAIATYFMMQDQPEKEWKNEAALPSADEMEYFIQQNLHETARGPMALKDVDSFEKANAKMDLAINVIFQDETGNFFPCRPSKHIHAKHQINLVLFFTHLDSSCPYIENMANLDVPKNGSTGRKRRRRRNSNR